MMLSMLKGYQYYVVYVEMLLVTSMMLSMWKGCKYDVVYVESYQYDVVYVERLPV